MRDHHTTQQIDMHQPPAIGTDPMGWTWSLARPQAAAERMRLRAVPCAVTDEQVDVYRAAIFGARLALREAMAS